MPPTLGDEANAPATLKTMREKVTAAGITIYQSSISDDGVPGYYCYYYYWNRHNDNETAGVMGPMEFAVVRNTSTNSPLTKSRVWAIPASPATTPTNPLPAPPTNRTRSIST